MNRWRHSYSSNDPPLPPSVARFTDLGPVGRVVSASHTRWEDRSYDRFGRPSRPRVSGVVEWIQAPLTPEDVQAFYWRVATPPERFVIVLRGLWDLCVALLLWAITTLLGGFLGFVADPHGLGPLVGLGVGFVGFFLLGWLGSLATKG